MANVLITGGAGFIGSHTADALLAAGHHVRILDILDPQIHRRTTRFPDYLDPRIECMRGDVCDRESAEQAVKDIDVVFHLAALTGVGQSMYDLRAYTHVNCTGTATLLEALVKRDQPLQRLVLSSSRAVYGEGTHRCPEHGVVNPLPRQRTAMEMGDFELHCSKCCQVLESLPTAEDQPLRPTSVYAITKRQQEEICQYAANTFGLPVTCLRYFNVYGSRQSLQNPYTGVVSIFYARIKSGAPIYLYEQGKPLRDFVHVSDVARANLAAMVTDTAPGSVINVGTGTRHTIRDISNALAAAMELPIQMEDRGEFRVGDIFACYADLRRASTLLGFTPQIDLHVGMQEFVSWAAGCESMDLYQKTVDELSRHGLFGRAKETPPRRP